MSVDTQEAKFVLDAEVQKFRGQSYEQLKQLLKEPLNYELGSPPLGATYHIEVEVFWDVPKTPGDLRVLISVSGESLSSFTFPLSDSFIISPTGAFVGE